MAWTTGNELIGELGHAIRDFERARPRVTSSLRESLAVCWLFPGKTVRVDCPCLDCGLPISVEIRDVVLLRVEPEGLTDYVAVPFWKWFDDIPYA